MAAIPTIIHLGNGELNGGRPTVLTTLASAGAFTTWTLLKNKPQLNWYVPHLGTTGALDTSYPYLPWYDVYLGGTGAFGPYHHIPGIIPFPYNGMYGDCPTAVGFGLGSSSWWIQKFAEKYFASPYFKAIKLAYPGGLMDKFYVGAASYNLALGHFNNAISVASPDTLDVKLIILDMAQWTDGDVSTIASWFYGSPTYKTRMTALIDELRNVVFACPDALVILISPAPSLLLTTGTAFGAAYVKQLHFELSQELDNVRVIEMQDKDLGTSSGTFGDLGFGSDRRTYEQNAYFDQGQRIYDMFVRWETDPAPLINSQQIPMILSIGDSQAVGPVIAAAQTALYSNALIGPRSNQYIWNNYTNSIELIQLGNSCNINTSGTITTNAGSAITLTDRLSERYPDGFLFVHMGKNGSAVSSDQIPAYSSTAYGRWRKGLNENYEQYAQVVANAKSACMTQTGATQILKVPVVEAIFIQLGDNDVGTLTTSTMFKSELKNLIIALRADYTKPMYGIEVPVILTLPHINSALGSVSNRALIRQAIIEICSELKQCGYINIDSKNLNADGIHYAVDTSLSNGEDQYEKFLEIISDAIPVV